MRLLPLTMFVAGMLLAVRVAEVVRGGEQVFGIGSVKAQSPQPGAPSGAPDVKVPETPVRLDETPPPAPAPAVPANPVGEGAAEAAKALANKNAPKPVESSSSGSSSGGEATAEEGQAEGHDAGASSSSSSSSSGGEEKKAEEGHGAAKEGEKPADGEHGEAATEGEGHGEGEGEKKKEDDKTVRGKIVDKPEEDPASGKGLAPQARYFSPIELEILQTLTKRRAQLDSWQKELEVKENLLSNVEKRIDEKVVAIEAMKEELKGMLVQYETQEDDKIKSLVKIYESMKPRDAARIFDEVEMPVLLLVISKMSEKKVAPILAGMDAKKAKQLTVELAEQRRMQGSKLAARGPAAGVATPAAPAPAPAPAAAKPPAAATPAVTAPTPPTAPKAPTATPPAAPKAE